MMDQEKSRLALDLAKKAIEAYAAQHRKAYGLDGAWDAHFTGGNKALAAIADAQAGAQVVAKDPAGLGQIGARVDEIARTLSYSEDDAQAIAKHRLFEIARTLQKMGRS
jgi:hypothetical protein